MGWLSDLVSSEEFRNKYKRILRERELDWEEYVRAEEKHNLMAQLDLVVRRLREVGYSVKINVERDEVNE